MGGDREPGSLCPIPLSAMLNTQLSNTAQEGRMVILLSFKSTTQREVQASLPTSQNQLNGLSCKGANEITFFSQKARSGKHTEEAQIISLSLSGHSDS